MNSTVEKANELFQRAAKNFEEIQLYLTKYEMEINSELKEKYLNHLQNLIRIQELLIQSHTRLTSIEMKEFNLLDIIKLLKDPSGNNQRDSNPIPE